jgi:hypothetical protein
MEHTAQEQATERLWQNATRIVIALTIVGGGYTVSYLQYGDAVELRAKMKQKQTRIHDLENDREQMATLMTQVGKDKAACDKDLAACKSGGAAPAAAQ